MSQNERLV